MRNGVADGTRKKNTYLRRYCVANGGAVHPECVHLNPPRPCGGTCEMCGWFEGCGGGSSGRPVSSMRLILGCLDPGLKPSVDEVRYCMPSGEVIDGRRSYM